MDYISKPVISPLLLRRIKTQMSLIDYQKELKKGAKLGRSKV
jgi:hypothetical protein